MFFLYDSTVVKKDDDIPPIDKMGMQLGPDGRTRDPETGLKYFSAQDMANLLAGRDVMVARVADELCRQVREAISISDKEKASAGITSKFNALGPSGAEAARVDDHLNRQAFVNTLNKPEFSRIKERFSRVSDVLEKSIKVIEDTMEEKDWGDAVVRITESGGVQIVPSLQFSEMFACTPQIIDPILSLGKLPPVPQAVADMFLKEQGREYSRLRAVDFRGSSDDIQAEMEKTSKIAQEMKIFR